MEERNYEPIKLSGVKLLFRNFEGSGNKFKYAVQGKRTFSVLLNEELADELRSQGWNVKQLRATDEYAEVEYHLPVEVSYRVIQPKVWLVTSKGKKLLSEDTIMTLDSAEIAHVELTVSPSYWTRDDGSTGIKAYLRSMFVTIVEDELDLKYADIPDILDSES